MQVRATFEVSVFEPVGADDATLDDLARSAGEGLLPWVEREFPGARLVEVGRERRYFRSIERSTPLLAESPSAEAVPF